MEPGGNEADGAWWCGRTSWTASPSGGPTAGRAIPKETNEVHVPSVIAEGRLFHRQGNLLAVYDLRPESYAAKK